MTAPPPNSGAHPDPYPGWDGPAARQHDSVLVAFAQYPTPGRVKTRLGRSIGFSQAARLYLAFLQDLAPRFHHGTGISAALAYDVIWVFVPRRSTFPQLIAQFIADSEPIDHPPIPPRRVVFWGHDDKDLAGHQVAALRFAAQEGYTRAVIVSTDSPHLDSTCIIQAFADLASADIVLGPATDGGYYLLGIRGQWDLLDGLAMSVSDVCAAIIGRAHDRRLTVSTLQPTFDIDTAEDLMQLVYLLQTQGPALCRHTWAALQRTALLP